MAPPPRSELSSLASPKGPPGSARRAFRLRSSRRLRLSRAKCDPVPSPRRSRRLAFSPLIAIWGQRHRERLSPPNRAPPVAQVPAAQIAIRGLNAPGGERGGRGSELEGSRGETPSGQDPQPFQQQPVAPPTVISVSGPMDPAGVPVRSDQPEPRGQVAAGLAALAVVLTLVGCFFPFFTTEHRLDFDRSDKLVIVVVQGAWETMINQPGGRSLTMSTSPVGIPLLIAATILLAATIVSARAALLRRPGTLDRWFVTIGAVFLPGVVSPSPCWDPDNIWENPPNRR